MPHQFSDVERTAAERLIRLALEEDLGEAGDITSRAFLRADELGTVRLVARRPGIVAGLPIVSLVFAQLAPPAQVCLCVRDGAEITAGEILAEMTGPVRTLLAGERTVLNFVTHLSGIATATRQYVNAIAGTRAKIYDTRKTLPGWRHLAKYAVRCGGGTNHRLGLHDAVLIKDNHLAAWSASDPARTIAGAVLAARQSVPAGTVIEVEVDTLAQLEDALQGAPDIVLLDNMTCDQMREAVALRNARAPQVELEASGGITLATLAEIASTGVERISSGALTHSVIGLDLGFDWKLGTSPEKL